MLLKEIAHSRTGDKGNISVISVMAYQQEDYKPIKEKVTVEKLKDYFKDIVHGKITRYEIESIGALNFVMEDALGGGVTRSLAIDMHGKTLGSALLEMKI
ncbi:AtuA-related protein [Coprobacillus cateniformis]|uniref:AtuA-related protein n=1 Tax=Coprobacillus cateniformis TaxID=100884 RepID=UPI0034A347E5